MSRTEYVYGCIVGQPGSRNFPGRLNRILRANAAAALRSLPARDDCPYLTRNVFSPLAGDYPQPGFFEVQMIHFGAFCRDLADGWEEWLLRLGRLLGRLYWRGPTPTCAWSRRRRASRRRSTTSPERPARSGREGLPRRRAAADGRAGGARAREFPPPRAAE